jgi:hypothetical protein
MRFNQPSTVRQQDAQVFRYLRARSLLYDFAYCESNRLPIKSLQPMARQKELFKVKMARAAFFVPLLVLLFPILVLYAASYWMYRVTLYLLIWLWWSRNGKDVLLVYSNSPIWHGYMTTQILPLVQERAIVLNWSERRSWRERSLAVRAFNMFKGARDFNPMIILFRPFRAAKSFRFFPSFKAWKHGDPKEVEQLRSELMQAL